MLKLIAKGLSNAEIGGALVIAEQTDENLYVGHILAEKLSLHVTAPRPVVVAYETGLALPRGAAPPGPLRFDIMGLPDSARPTIP